jgi:3-polyprenyl-4-hydroxybenzoate decarboxylase
LIATFRGETAPVVKSLTNDILVPADAELTLEGYLDERGYAVPEGPYGEYVGDIDIRDEGQVEWAMGTRFQADRDLMVLQGMMGMTMDPSLEGRRTGAKAGFDCTKPFGRAGEIPLTRSAAKVFGAPARFQTVEQALASGPLFYAEIVEALGSDDGREVACALDALRQRGRVARDRDGRYHLGQFKPGHTGIVGELYHDPNEGT